MIIQRDSDVSPETSSTAPMHRSAVTVTTTTTSTKAPTGSIVALPASLKDSVSSTFERPLFSSGTHKLPAFSENTEFTPVWDRKGIVTTEEAESDSEAGGDDVADETSVAEKQPVVSVGEGHDSGNDSLHYSGSSNSGLSQRRASKRSSPSVRIVSGRRNAFPEWCRSVGKQVGSRVTCFLSLHVIFILSTAIIGAILLYIFENSMGNGLSVTDAIFQTISAVTCTGLSTVDISTWTKPSLVVLVICCQLCGVTIGTCLSVAVVRYFRVRNIWLNHTQRSRDITPEHDDETTKLVSRPIRSSATVSGGFFHDYDMERRALKRLIFIIICYQWGLQLVCFTILGFYLSYSKQRELMDSRGINPWWWSGFHCFSSWNNAGFGLFQDNLIPFQSDWVVLLTLALMICAGNTMLPLGLRFAVWMTRNVYERKLPKSQQPLRYILVDPTRCSLHIFPGIHTKILMLVFGTLNVIDTIAFVCFMKGLMSTSDLWLDAFFLSVDCRTAGFSVVDMSTLSQPLLWIYIKSMFISAYPIAYVRKYREEEIKLETKRSVAPPSKLRTLGKYVSSIILHPFTWLYLAVFIISCFELGSEDQAKSDIYKIMFEVTSAYGTVGLSMGYPGVFYSYAGVVSPFSKYILMLVMLMGRHRGLPKHIYHRDTRNDKQHLMPLDDWTTSSSVPKF